MKKIDEANSKATAKLKFQHYSHKARETENDVRKADTDRNPVARSMNTAVTGARGSQKRKLTMNKIKRMKQAAAVAKAKFSTSDRPDYNLPKKKFLSGGKPLREFLEESAELFEAKGGWKK